MRTRIVWLALAALTFSGLMLLTSPPVDAQPIVVRTVTVNCGTPGQTIANALKRQVVGGGLLVKISGTCNEHVDIFRDDVTLLGVGAAPTIHGPTTTDATIALDGAKRVTISSLTVTGGQDGISGRGSSFNVDGVTVQGAARFGTIAGYGSQMFIDGCTVRQSGSVGVAAAITSSLVITNSTVSQNTGVGIQATRASYARIGQDFRGSAVAGPVTITGNGGGGVTISESSAANLVASEIASNTGHGVSISRGSSAQIGIGSQGFIAPNSIHDNTRSGISVFQASQAAIQGNTIQDQGSNGIVVIGSSATIIGNQIRRSGARGISVAETSTAKIGVVDGNDSLNGNLVENNGSDGIGIFTGASAVVGGNTIQGNTLDGISVGRAAGRLVGSNKVQNNSGSGVSANDTASIFQGVGDFGVPNVADTIQNNTGSGISGFNGASLNLRNVLVQGNGLRGISLSHNSSAQIQTSTIQNNTGDGISLFNASVLQHSGSPSNVIITGNGGFGIQCFGTETSLSGDATGVTGNTGGQVSCSGF